MSPRELAAWMALERIPVASGAQTTGALEAAGYFLRLTLVAKTEALLEGCPEEITAASQMVADATALCGEWLV